MRAARFAEKGKVELVDAPQPEPGPGQVRLHILQCGICGSDLHGFRAGRAGFRVGHEVCGIVERLGPDTQGISEGARVAMESFGHCGECAFCRRGDYNLCESYVHMPGGEYGGMAEKVVAPATAFYPVPDSFSNSQAAMVEPLAVAFRAVSRTGLAEGNSLGVIGAGTIGLLCTAVAAQRGASPIIVVAKHPHQAGMAKKLGADVVIVAGKADQVKALREACAGSGPDAVIDSVAVGTSFSTALAAAGRQGRVVLVGEPRGPLLVALGPVIHRELEVTGSCCYGMTDGKPDFTRAIELIRDGKVDVDRPVTHTLPLERIEEAFRVAADKTTGSVKVMVRTAD